ncbi:MAG: hypothetical protein AMS18_13630 [Gemmatimonas sp. SG8_17]|nr:MAG: hypothetical protein AMS18_13630 [Gemmatimonas sp. SG8_17]
MVERHPNAEESKQSRDDRADEQLDNEAESRQEKEPQQKAHRMSVEKHLAGLWKMLGLGD